MSFAGLDLFTGNQASKQAGMAKRQEQQKQALIQQGLDRINAIFGGGSYNMYTPAGGTYNPTQQYYKSDHKGGYSMYTPPHWYTQQANKPGAFAESQKYLDGMGVANPAGFFGGGGFGSSPFGFSDIFGSSRPPSPNQSINKGKLYQMVKSPTYKGFDENFYKQRADAYSAYAMPQLAQQYKQASNAIDFGLANRGLLNSGANNQAQSNLNLALGQQKQNVVDTGIAQSQALRTNVENSRQQAVQQLYQSADPGQAQLQALNSYNSLSQPSAYAPIANAFSGLANQYALNQVLSTYRNNGYNAPLQNFNANAGALPGNTY